MIVRRAFVLSATSLVAILGAGLTSQAVVRVPTAARTSTVAHWRFQNGVKGTPAGSSHLIVDSSGNDRHGLAFGGPVFRRVELPSSNQALSFDGHDDRVFVPDDPLFHLTGSLTLEAYIRVEGYPGHALNLSYIVFRGDDRPGFDPFFLGIAESGQLVFLIADALNRGTVVRSPRPIPIGRLVHVAGTFDAETGAQSLWLNGERVAGTHTEIRPAGPLGGTGPGIGIGNTQTPSMQAFCGLIDEVRISGAALDAEQFLPAASGR